MNSYIEKKKNVTDSSLQLKKTRVSCMVDNRPMFRNHKNIIDSLKSAPSNLFKIVQMANCPSVLQRYIATRPAPGYGSRTSCSAKELRQEVTRSIRSRSLEQMGSNIDILEESIRSREAERDGLIRRYIEVDARHQARIDLEYQQLERLQIAEQAEKASRPKRIRKPPKPDDDGFTLVRGKKSH